MTAYRPETLTLTEAVSERGVCQRRTPIRFAPVTAVEEQTFSAVAALPSVTLLRAAPGQELWEIAKTYGSTVEAIRAANPEDAERMYLVIPKAET